MLCSAFYLTGASLHAQLLESLAQVMVYVDGFLVGEVAAKGDTPHHIIHRLCDLDMNLENEMEQPTPQQGVGFALKLPELRSGRHEVLQSASPMRSESTTPKYWQSACISTTASHSAAPPHAQLVTACCF